MWARAQVANELIALLSGQEQVIVDIQKRIANLEDKNVKKTTTTK